MREVPFVAPAGVPSGVEVGSLAALAARLPRRSLETPQRPAFHHLLAPSVGVLRHAVDFVDHAVPPGSWLWVRPGQVQQWHDMTGTDGAVVFFETDFLDAATAAAAHLDDPYGAAVHTPAPRDAEALRLAAEHLRHEFDALGRMPLEPHTAALRHLLAVLVLRLSHLARPAAGPAVEHDETFLRFRDAVERDFARSRRVEEYARALGYSPRTLTRAAYAATGLGAKEFVDRRVVLEAKRVLAHSDASVARIAAQLGFSSPTNFGKFFQHRTGHTPLGFRSAVRGRHDTVEAEAEAETGTGTGTGTGTAEGTGRGRGEGK
ncbi:transcriptional regulator [Streptomyces kanasensis]|uniref:Transcriptional regulator n=1 Tax=Streptomyces kanasensis TaxID=936756 RepID=A0A100Y6X7_9ACTN|nr:transcriptional regulator [Streptomyces kanasensis]